MKLNKSDVIKNPDVFGYYWAYEKLDEIDASWMLVMYDADGFVYYGSVKFRVNDFTLWIKANFSEELRELYAIKR